MLIELGLIAALAAIYLRTHALPGELMLTAGAIPTGLLGFLSRDSKSHAQVDQQVIASSVDTVQGGSQEPQEEQTSGS